MPRLLRPNIPVDVKCRVALRQLGEMWPDDVIEASRGKLGALLAERIDSLATQLGCDVADMRLDHDPALGARVKVYDANGVHVDYDPPANSPDHLSYRPHGPQFDRSHHIKTQVRGDGAQYPDRVLIKRQRRLEKRERGEFTEPRNRLSKSGKYLSRNGKTGGRLGTPGGLTSCRLGRRCQCERRARKTCGNWKTRKIGR